METPPSPAPQPSNRAFTRGKVYRISGWRWLLFWPCALALDLYYKSLRFSIPKEDRETLEATPSPRIIVVWHNRSLIFPALARYLDRDRFRCLVSASKNAAWEAAFFEHHGLTCIRGSSTRRSIQATREMVKTVRDGYDFGISPDGPSGPLYSFQRGTVMVARQCNVPVVLLTANAPHAWRLKTWDRHLVPWPFTRVEARAKVIPPLREMNFANDKEAANHLRQAALSISDE